MGNVESCCAYGASPRSDRTPKLKPGGAYRGSNNRSNGHYAHQQVRIETQLIKERIKFDISLYRYIRQVSIRANSIK